ncbi:hypothetical protein M3Y95_00427600 [Aphelenchoides besseyi]|nr:hypothetical protein M3Y95_00427600 [Aphelenchoides besseyi]
MPNRSTATTFQTTTMMPMEMHGNHSAVTVVEPMDEMSMHEHETAIMETFSLIDVFQYAFAIVVSVFILVVYSLHFYKWYKNSSMRVSIAILINMMAWVVTEVGAIVYSVNSLLAYGKNDLAPLPIFWFGSLYFSGIIAVSLSVFLLQLDRCFVLSFPMATSSSCRNVLAAILVTFQYFVFILVLYIEEYPTKKVAQCSVIDCVAAQHAETLNATKIGYGLLNTVMALFFGVLLCRYNNSRRVRQSNTRRANFIVGLTVVLQIGFNFIPSLINYISHKVSMNHDMTSNSAGPQVSTLAQLDGLFTALLYTTIFVKNKQKTENFVTRTQ